MDKKILIVDDELDFTNLLVRSLKDSYQIQSLNESTEAFNSLNTENYDLLITDLTMPKVRGEELVSWCLERIPSLPILVITGNSSYDGEVLTRKHQVLFKPFSSQEFKLKIESFFK